MKSNWSLILLFSLLLLAATTLIYACSGDDDDDSEATDDDAAPTDDDTSADDDTASDDDTTADDDAVGDDDTASADIYTDDATGLMWQMNDNVDTLGLDDSIGLCDGLTLGGYDDWRLPTISELRSLVDSCEGTTLSGNCGVFDECLDYSTCYNDTCEGCQDMEGPGEYGCYWNATLGGECDTYWSSSMRPDMADWAWELNFRSARVLSESKGNYNEVRCVRTAK